MPCTSTSRIHPTDSRRAARRTAIPHRQRRRRLPRRTRWGPSRRRSRAASGWEEARRERFPPARAYPGTVPTARRARREQSPRRVRRKTHRRRGEGEKTFCYSLSPVLLCVLGRVAAARRGLPLLGQSEELVAVDQEQGAV